ncbi:MAG: hypothetical protein GY811_16185, partial [Myxococcales bacterium]|nr:hypothetical protein [Myxococcales bacterium]
NKRIIIVAAVLVAGVIGYKLFSKKSYPPIIFADETYKHVQDTEINKIENHFYTPNGVDIEKADEFIQISKYGHPDLTENQIDTVQKQVIRSFGLKAVSGHDDRFYGIFQGALPVYGYMGPEAFVLHFGPEGEQGSADDLLEGASGIIDELEFIADEI